MFTLDAINLSILFILKPLLVIWVCVYLIHVAPTISSAGHHLKLVIATLSPLLLSIGTGLFPSLNLKIISASFTELHTIHFELNVLVYGLLGLYLIGVFSGLFYLIFGMLEIKNLKNTAKPLNDPRIIHEIDRLKSSMCVKAPTTLYINEGTVSPFVWGLWHFTIVMPKESLEWDTKKLQRVLCHELGHIKRHDWLAKIILHVVCSVFWFLPALWKVSKKCQWFAEVACDDYVVKMFNCRSEYAQDLLDFSHLYNQGALRENTDTFKVVTLNFFERTQLYHRINTVLDPSIDRVPPTRKETIAIVLLGCMFIFILSVIQVESVNTKHSDNKSVLFQFYPHFENTNNYPQLNAPSVVSLEDLKEYFPSSFLTSEFEQMSVRANVWDINHLKHDNNKAVDYLDASSIHSNNAHLTHLKQYEIALPSKVIIQGYVPVSLVTPEYPKFALKKRLEGRVVVKFDIGIDGIPFNVSAMQGSDYDLLAKSAIDAVKHSRYTPLSIDGHPIITKNAKAAFNFTLDRKQ